jgi:hypothetical protein
MSKQPTWNDFQEAKPAELKKTYKLNDRQLENAYRNHLNGADANDRRSMYDKLYRRNRRDA